MQQGLEGAPETPARHARGESEDLAGKARWGLLLTSGSTGARTALELLTSVFLARLLEPAEFGIVAVAATFLGLSFIIGNLGVGIAVVQARALASRDRNTAYFLATGVGLLFTIALSALGPIVATFFQMPVLKIAMPIMSVQVLLSGAAATPIALLRRALQFGRVAFVDIAGTLSYGITSIGLALGGFGVWSLVWAPVVAGVVVLALAHALSGFIPGWSLSRESAKRFLGYGGTLTVKNVFVHVARHADKFIVAKLLGAHATGLYARAFNWASIPDMRFMPVFQTVSFPILCRLRDDMRSFVDWYLKVTVLGAMAMAPLSLGLLALADDFTVAVFGSKWRGIVPAMRILCLAGFLNSLNRLSGAAMEALGKLRYEVLTQTVYAVLLIVGALLAAPFGIEAVGWAVLVAAVVLYLLKGETLRRATGLRMRRYLGTAAPSLTAGLVMVAAIYAVLTYSGVPAPALAARDHWLRLIVGGLVGAMVYPLGLFLLARRDLSLLLNQLPLLFNRAPAEPAPGESRRSPGIVVIQGHSPYAESIYRGLYEAYARRLPVIYFYADPGKWSPGGVLQRRQFAELDVTGPGLHTLRVSPPLPGSRIGLIASLNRWLSLRALLRYLREHGQSDVVLVTQQPHLIPSFRGLPALRVYEVIDDYVGLQPGPRAARAVRRAHLRALEQCDVIWGTAAWLVEAIREERPDAIETTNGVDYRRFAGAAERPFAEALNEIRRPLVGLIGRLNDRVDWALLEGICQARKSWSIVVIGPLYGTTKKTRLHLARLEELANFHRLPAVAEAAIPSYIEGLDVCLIPYHPSGSNLSVNPLKLYQYLAVGKPVVASRIPALESFTDVIEVADDLEGYVRAIESALRHSADEGVRERRQGRARQFDWQAVADSQISRLQEHLRGADVAVQALGEPGIP